ncbi:MAG: hypothetical protein R6U39_07155, partial [Candidatus Aegiribacteria sp.]
AAGEVMNIACGDSITVNRLAEEVAALTGRTDISPGHGPPRPGDVKHSRADIGLAEELLSYRPVVPFSEGLKKTVSFMQQRRA